MKSAFKNENWSDQVLLRTEESNEDSSSESTPTTSHQQPAEKKPALASEETTTVNRIKVIMYTVLFLAGSAIGSITYRLLRDEQEKQFQQEYRVFSQEIFQMAEENAVSKFGEVESLSLSLTALVLSSTDQSWPFVTMPYFERKVELKKELTGAEMIMFSPLVSAKDRAAWEEYSVQNQDWIRQGLAVHGLDDVDPGPIPESIYSFEVDDQGHIQDDHQEPSNPDLRFQHSLPVWQLGAPPVNSSIVNGDLLSNPSFNNMVKLGLEARQPLLSEITDLSFLYQCSSGRYMEALDNKHTMEEHTMVDDAQPRSYIFQPVFNSFDDDALVVGFATAILPWHSYFQNLLPANAKGVIVEVEDSCGSHFTYEIDGHRGHLLGEGYLHDTKYEYLHERAELAAFASLSTSEGADSKGCRYFLDVYPSDRLRAQYTDSNQPLHYTLAILSVFLFTILVFVVYDYAVQRRQQSVVNTAERTQAIVSSIFPKNVEERLLEEAEAEAQRESDETKGVRHPFRQQQQKGDIEAGGGFEMDKYKPTSKPIADLFVNCTVAFMDIVGFTAWSSAREPTQVFTLLETLYAAFDDIATRRRVFKVETVGDCYVAVAGLPDPRKDHFIVMARFARDCLYRMNTLTRQLEVELGPDTADLAIRIGLHSGPVTAGVLRGERARFQLFGDTMNTCARVETMGAAGRIHISEETATLLIDANKGHWVRKRVDTVVAKGKGELQTYWLDLKNDSARSSASGSSGTDQSGKEEEVVDIVAESAPQSIFAFATPTKRKLDDKEQRLIDWNTVLLQDVLRKVVARRQDSGVVPDVAEALDSREQQQLRAGGHVLEDVQEIVSLPKFDPAALEKKPTNPLDIDLGETVARQAREYVQTIAAMYRPNPFHGFEHASHVTMSTVKLLGRIVAPNLKASANDFHKDLHDHTHGITSDPLTQFAVILAALVHDVDHPGVPNSQLVKENAHIASVYKNKSIAEQNSIDLAWNLLMDDSFTELRRTIYTTATEFQRFRQLLVNSVMATDIMDKDLNNLRKDRWSRAFATSGTVEESSADATNRKATIVIEHLIQASDVAHTMQHWMVYIRWNERLFCEMYKAYKAGRAEKNPADGWYEGELGFYDHYIIPLARKLADCGVFGVSSEEYLNYALNNRREWQSRGRSLVESMIEKCENELEDSK